MMRFFLVIAFGLLISCNAFNKALTAQDIIDKAIAAHCSGNCEKSTITFTFRGKTYKSIKNGGTYEYERIITKGDKTIRDVLSNTGFERYVNDSLQNIKKNIAVKISNSVNSVHYFAQLPYGLNSPAVKKELLGEANINGKPYYEIGVTFKKDGGGTDFEDKFVYWINKNDFSLGYLAYSYAVNGGGIRFREAYNKRIINGITFLDYNNYKPEMLDLDLKDLDKLFQEGKLELLSKIETENVEVILN
ncbi:hypothetical protein SAMN05421824_2595 [Hyunsoonleella jejuensis]|uniref:Deoxyribose-phosphate aldolase n=1 Tax=Hyunsoonleella jejuensis TaxID=419940 RepID=A0A1H9JMH6_9FLAO|nr:DUF6503 family protein [Hyunsoonleella jejuensis]SEQ88141.1 hypothetical protein SAMN05421824_2595 [Hyunsoonleella jejuensis]